MDDDLSRSRVREDAALYGQSRVTPTHVRIAEIREGLPVEEFDALLDLLQCSSEELGKWLGISKATLHRRRQSGRLSKEESDHIMRYARLFGKATDVMETEEFARQWLRSKQRGLGNFSPFDYADTEAGAREVEHLLGRMEHGVIS